MSSFWLVLKQQWTIEDISIFSNSSHLEWRAGLSDTILKGTHTGTIPARFGLIRLRGFRGEDLNVKVYDVRRTDAKWWQKLTWPLARWAKNTLGIKYLLLYNKRVISWILVNIVPRKLVQYDILLGTIFTNIHPIIFYGHK